MSRDDYSLVDFGWLAQSSARMDPYYEALKRVVTPGCRVIDLGAGPGLFALMACRLGAGSVVAIEPNEWVGLLMPLARANGCADRIEGFNGMSTDFPGPPADVIVADIRGPLPFHGSFAATMNDARERLLKPGGTMIPACDRLRIALASAPEDYERLVSPWAKGAYGLDLSLGHRFVINNRRKVRLSQADLLSAPAPLADIDYISTVDPDMAAQFDLGVERAGIAHGLLVWFDADLGGGIGFTNAPGSAHQVYGQMLFPFERTLSLKPGDRVSGEIQANLIDGDYVWSWRSRATRNRKPLVRETRQSTFLSRMIDPAALESRSAEAVPQWGEVHEAVRTFLDLIDGKRSLDEVASELRQSFPAHFRDHGSALNFAARLANADFGQSE